MSRNLFLSLIWGSATVATLLLVALPHEAKIWILVGYVIFFAAVCRIDIVLFRRNESDGEA